MPFETTDGSVATVGVRAPRRLPRVPTITNRLPLSASSYACLNARCRDVRERAARVGRALDRPLEHRDDGRRPLPDAGLERDVRALDAIGRDDDRPAGGGADLPLQLREPAAARTGGGPARVAAPQRVRGRRRDPRRRRARCACPSAGRSRATPGWAEIVTFATAAPVAALAGLRIRARGRPGEHERHREDRGRRDPAGADRRAAPSADRVARVPRSAPRAGRGANRRARTPSRIRIGRAAQTIVSDPSSATLAPNSVVCGAIRRHAMSPMVTA